MRPSLGRPSLCEFVRLDASPAYLSHLGSTTFLFRRVPAISTRCQRIFCLQHCRAGVAICLLFYSLLRWVLKIQALYALLRKPFGPSLHLGRTESEGAGVLTP